MWWDQYPTCTRFVFQEIAHGRTYEKSSGVQRNQMPETSTNKLTNSKAFKSFHQVNSIKNPHLVYTRLYLLNWIDVDGG